MNMHTFWYDLTVFSSAMIVMTLIVFMVKFGARTIRHIKNNIRREQERSIGYMVEEKIEDFLARNKQVRRKRRS